MSTTRDRFVRSLISASTLSCAALIEIISCSRDLNTCRGPDCLGAGGGGGRDASGDAAPAGGDVTAGKSSRDAGGDPVASDSSAADAWPSRDANGGGGRPEDGANGGSGGSHPEQDANVDASSVDPPCNLEADFQNPMWPGLAFLPRSWNDEGFTLSDDENTAYFASTRSGDNYDIYVSTRDPVSGMFDHATRLDSPVNTTSSERQPSLSPDGNRLFYTDELDIFVAGRGTVGAHFSEGLVIEDIQTGSQETEPFIAKDGKSLYFVSDRNGSRDIFVSEIDITGRYSTPRLILGDSVKKGAPVLTRDQLTMFYHEGDPETSTIRVTHRLKRTDSFETSQVVDADPFFSGPEWPEAISNDGCTLYFVEISADRQRQVWMATRPKYEASTR